MGIHSYVGGIFAKFLAIILIMTGFFLILSSGYISQQTGAPIELYWIASWIIFIAGLFIFAAGAIAQRRALRRMKS
jgi:hypothetical protein